MARVITGTLTVSFQRADEGADSAGLVIEVDDRDDGLNGGKTTFRPGDSVHYLVYLPPGFSISQHIVTAGSRSGAGSGNRTVTDELLLFGFSDSARLRYPSTGSASLIWQGVSPGTPTLQDDRQTVLIPEEGLGILKANYSAPYSAFRLSGVPVNVLQVAIGIIATAPD